MHVAASGTLTLARVTLRGNGGGGEFLTDGGGLVNDAGTVTLTQSTVTGFRVDGQGGGLQITRAQ